MVFDQLHNEINNGIIGKLDGHVMPQSPYGCLPTPMTLASGGSLMCSLVVHQPSAPSIRPAVQSLRRGLSTNPGVTM